jgi:DNA-binding transcriptional MerR regulator
MAYLKIGQVARIFGLSHDALRYYERERLLPPLPRTASRYRLYDERALERLRLIRVAQGLGLALADIRLLIALEGETAEAAAGGVTRCLRRRMAVLEREIDALATLRDRLAQLVDRWEARRRHLRPTLAAVVALASDNGGAKRA